jgi:homeobox-leucine zipper protein
MKLAYILILSLLFDNQKQWSLVFSNIVSKAIILGVLSSPGVEGKLDGTLQVVT